MRLLLLVCFVALALAHMSPLEKLVEALEPDYVCQVQSCHCCRALFRSRKHCAISSTNEVEVAAPCSGPQFDGTCGIEKCKKECEARAGCHGFSATTGAGVTTKEYDTCWLDMGEKTGEAEYYSNDGGLSVAYKCQKKKVEKKEVCIKAGESVGYGKYQVCCKGTHKVTKTRMGFTYSYCEKDTVKTADVCQVKSCAKRQPGSTTTKSNCAISSTNEVEVAAPCSGPQFDGTCGIKKCKKECEARAGCHGFSATTGAGVTTEEYDTCWLDMGATAGEAEYYDNDGGLSVAYICADSEEEDM